jgi:hypothetical protein
VERDGFHSLLSLYADSSILLPISGLTPNIRVSPSFQEENRM